MRRHLPHAHPTSTSDQSAPSRPVGRLPSIQEQKLPYYKCTPYWFNCLSLLKTWLTTLTFGSPTRFSDLILHSHCAGSPFFQAMFRVAGLSSPKSLLYMKQPHRSRVPRFILLSHRNSPHSRQCKNGAACAKGADSLVLREYRIEDVIVMYKSPKC